MTSEVLPYDPPPRMFRVRQHFEVKSLRSPGEDAWRALESSSLRSRLKPGQSVAITVGSRGIANLPTIIAAVARFVRSLEATPFVIPAMGSHGGGTAAKQTEMLASLGVTPESVGCEVRSSMETEILGETADGVPVHFDQHALAADHLIVVNRIKPHTRFSGRYQSGLLKMLLIGCGKRNGASTYHRANNRIPFDQLIETAVPLILKRRPVSMGLAIVENAIDETYQIEAVEPESLFVREPELLRLSQELMPSLPFDHADLLMVDQIGKDISGTGMDTNIIGRKHGDKVAGPDEYPKINYIYVRGLTERTHGNASGIGLAELCHVNVAREIDQYVTNVNCYTANHLVAAALPACFASDRDALGAAAAQRGLEASTELKWMWIRDTLHLEELLCSEAYFADAARRNDLEVLSEPEPFQFDGTGTIVTPQGPST